MQKYNKNFSQFEEGNEVSFELFQKCLDTDYKHKNKNVYRDILPQMKEIIKISTKSVKEKINQKDRHFCYVVLGYDFMVDVNFKVWLIEINRNPGMALSSDLIKHLLPRMLDDCFRLTLDKIFIPKYLENDPIDYKSPFPVEGYSDYENIFEFVVSLNENINI